MAEAPIDLRIPDAHSKCEMKKLQLHLAYMFAIVTLFVAFVLSDRWTDKPNFTEYLTNIATFVSLVLAFVAIFYSFISNSSLSQSLGNISKVSDEVTNARLEIGKVIDHAIQLEQSSAESIKSLQGISVSVSTQIGALNSVLDDVANKTEALHSTVESIPGRFDQLETRLSDFSSNKPKEEKPARETTPKSSKFKNEDINDFINYSSINGRLLIVACIEAYQNKRKLDLEAISKLILGSSVDYLFGYLISMSAIGIIDIKMASSTTKVYNMSYVDPILLEIAKPNIVASFEKKYADKTLRSYMSQIKEIEAHFSAPETTIPE